MRRMGCVGAGGALVLGSLVIAAPAAHAADPFPEGSTTINFDASMTIQAAGNPATINFTGSMTGTSDGAGHLSFPKAHISFAAATVDIILTGVVVQPSATTAITGTINTTTRVVTLSGSVQAALDLSNATPGILPNDNNCILGPFALSLSTQNTGGHQYTPTGDTATATVTDTSFTIPAIPGATAGCPSWNLINGGVPLPINAGNRSLVQDLDIFPPGVEPPSTTTTSTTTTTTVPPTLAPITTVPGPTLANTGSSDTPAMLFAAAFVLGGLALIRPARRRTRGDIRLRRTFRR